MKRTILAAMVMSLAVGSMALADPPQGYDHDHDRQDQRHDEHHNRDEHHDRDEHHNRDEHHGRDRYNDRGEHRGQMDFDSGRYERPHGWYAHRWHRGERLPSDYRSRAYVIADPGVYRLRPPPRGYYWVRVDNNAVLAAVATGVVVDVAANLFH